ncbi:hypothetical protein [Frigidibacter sp. MR17.24]|uniref:hypothetical protein n=1 Tax=Frigidibacter sp. MR17.24 TaxID=3127345 RepID=UPI00301315D1
MIFDVPIGTLRGMTDIHALLSEVQRYCELTGLSPVTVCRNATKNPRLWERLEGRALRTEKDAKALRQWMRDNPPQERGAA